MDCWLSYPQHHLSFQTFLTPAITQSDIWYTSFIKAVHHVVNNVQFILMEKLMEQLSARAWYGNQAEYCTGGTGVTDTFPCMVCGGETAV